MVSHLIATVSLVEIKAKAKITRMRSSASPLISENTLTKLPLEVLSQIASYLPRDDIVSLRHVSSFDASQP